MSKIIIGPSRSYCHNARTLIVKSREGGFVTQDCIDCGKPMSLSFNELPAISCEKCEREMEKGYDINGNYAYTCSNCRRSCLLSEMVPDWKEYFDEHGFGLDSDWDEKGNKRF